MMPLIEITVLLLTTPPLKTRRMQCTLELLINEIDVSEPQAKPEFLEKMVDLDVFEGDSPTFSVTFV